MHLSIPHRTLLRGVWAGAVVLAATSACSRDRADAGRDPTQVGEARPEVTPPDTQVGTATSSTATDTAVSPAGDVGNAGVETATPRPVQPPSRAETRDTVAVSDGQGVSGYRAMGHAGEDSSVDTTAGTDTTAAGYEPMARDTSTVLAQGDTMAPVSADTTARAEPDTATITAQLDTTAEGQTEVAIEDQPDTVTVTLKADSLAKYHKADRVRPPEDSTEILGQVNTDQANYDVEAVGDAEAEAVGAAQVQSTGNIATDAAAVALLTREGHPCMVVDADESRDVQWDMASSPATLNPCGTGTMTLPRIWTGEKK
jgi:hypothetical protein